MYNNPYYYYPYMNSINFANAGMGASTLKPRVGLFKGLSNIKWGAVLSNTQKTLNVINQAIPVYYQVKPIFGNLKSFTRLMNAFNEDDTKPTNSTNQINNLKKENKNNPTFFIN